MTQRQATPHGVLSALLWPATAPLHTWATALKQQALMQMNLDQQPHLSSLELWSVTDCNNSSFRTCFNLSTCIPSTSPQPDNVMWCGFDLASMYMYTCLQDHSTKDTDALLLMLCSLHLTICSMSPVTVAEHTHNCTARLICSTTKCPFLPVN